MMKKILAVIIAVNSTIFGLNEKLTLPQPNKLELLFKQNSYGCYATKSTLVTDLGGKEMTLQGLALTIYHSLNAYNTSNVERGLPAATEEQLLETIHALTLFLIPHSTQSKKKIEACINALPPTH